MTTQDPVLEQLRASDPLRNIDLPTLNADDFVDSLNLTDLNDYSRERHIRRVRLTLTAAAAAAVLLAIPVVVPHIGGGSGGSQPTAMQWLPNAAAAELDTLATKVVTTPLGNRYAYWSENQVNFTANYADPDATPARYWSDSTVQHWVGTTCNDRQVETWRSYDFVTPQDQAIWKAWADSPGVAAEDRAAANGGTHTWVGPQLWNSPGNGEAKNPCDRGGTFADPTPGYTAALPTEPAAMLNKITSDAAIDPTRDPQSVGDALIGILRLPWLTQQQRATAIEAVGLLPQPWTVTGRTNIAGHPALRLSYSANGLRDDVVVVAAAPGVWERSTTITDPPVASKWSQGTYEGLPAGTVISSTTITEAAIVASNTSK